VCVYIIINIRSINNIHISIIMPKDSRHGHNFTFHSVVILLGFTAQDAAYCYTCSVACVSAGH